MVSAASLARGPSGLCGMQEPAEPAAAAAEGGRIWLRGLPRLSPAVGGDADRRLARVGSGHGCSLAGTGPGECPSLCKLIRGRGEQHPDPGGAPSLLFRLCPPWRTQGALPTSSEGRERPGAGAPPRAAVPELGGRRHGAGRPRGAPLPQRPRKEVVAFLGEEKGSRSGQAQLPPLAPGSVRVDCPESMNEPRRAGTEPSQPCPASP